jgi:peroxiredoxin
MRLAIVLASLLTIIPGTPVGAADIAGQRAPGFSLPDLNLKQHDLQDYRGKVLLIEIMKTDCPHCRQFAQILDKVKAKYADRVGIVSVVHPPDNQKTVKEYTVANKIGFPVLFDCGQMAISYLMATRTKIGPQDNTITLPQVFIVDGNGMLRKYFSYSESTHPIFEGDGIFREIDQVLSARAKGGR